MCILAACSTSLCRLGLATLSEDAQTVSLLSTRFVPDAQDERLFGFLGANVGDHLAAAVDNVVHRDRRHVEQALFTDELSQASVQALRPIVQKLWAALAAEAVPELERLIAQDKAAGRSTGHRARIGLFSYHEALPETDHASEPQPDPAD